MSSRLREDLAAAIADGELVDWDALESARPPLWVRHFRVLSQLSAESPSARAALAVSSEPQRDAPAPVPWWLRIPATLAASQALAASVAVLIPAPDRTPVPVAPVVVNMLAFASSGLVLLWGARGDRRPAYLGALFLTVAAALAPRFLSNLGDMPLMFKWWRYGYADAFMALFLWLFVRDFPRLGRFTTLDGVARFVIRVSAVAGLVLYAANVALAYHLGQGSPLTLLSRSDARAAYWIILFSLQLPALVIVNRRTKLAPEAERDRVRIFAAALAVGAAPLLVESIVGTLVPGTRAWLARPGGMTIGAYVLFGFLSVVPVISAYAVLVQRVLTLRLVVARAVQYTLAKVTLLVVAVIPVMLLARYFVEHRDRRLDELLTSRTALLMMASTVTCLLLLRVRQQLVDLMDRAFLHVRTTPQDALASFSIRASATESVEDLGDLLAASLAEALGTDQVRVMSLRQNIGAFVPVQGVCQPLRRRTAIATLALESHDPINVEPADRRSIFQLLPPDERLWVRRADASLVQSIRLRRGDAPLLVVGPRRLGPGFTRQNQRFVSSIAAAASLAFQNLSQSGLSESPGGPPLTHEPQGVAAECTSCRRIQKWTVSACAYCGGALAHAVVPEILLGKFQVVERVGHGGMGIVYRGTDLVLGRSVAVKTLPRLSETAAMRLRREARTMASVTHPNLAVIFGAETWRGTPFLIVEFLEGGTLAARLDQGPLALDEALTVCATIAEVLASLHAAGILHRDIKPSNVGFSGAGQVKLLDFGLARLFTNHSDGSPGVPDARNAGPAASDNGRSMLVGTPLYMSPEAVHGHPAEPSFDLWSLGVVLYETLSGRPPFSGTSVAEVFAAIDSVDTADLRSPLRPCPHPVIEFACRMLARDRSLRPASATAVANELRRLTVDCCTQPAR